ncbi:MAG: hypothetical protein EAX91_10860 [Candidatus Lokiarchaeota archaeon]|nr:hypothetical protein [Candidatus Lokiarchaeota archaeon]
MIIEPFIKEYILLALRINRISDGYVDAYYGPVELEKIVETELIKSPKELINKARMLQNSLPEQISELPRRRFLKANLKAMEVFLNILCGKKIGFTDHVEAILGIKPETFQDDSEFYKLQEEFNLVYSGDGILTERMELYKERRRIPIKNLVSNFKRALELTCNRTKELFPDLLPEKESINVKFTEENVGWAFYNHYRGDFRSVIEINPFQPLYWTTFLINAAHEGYPGHHTEFSVKNNLLSNQLNWSEHSLILMNTPAGAITEGIAECASSMLFSPNEHIRIELEEFCLKPLEEDPIEILIKQFELKHKVKKFFIHLANLANIDNWSKKELIDYGMEFGFLPEINLESSILFLLNPKFRIIYYTYNYGRELITRKFGFPPKVDDFRYLLSNPVLPNEIV